MKNFAKIIAVALLSVLISITGTSLLYASSGSTTQSSTATSITFDYGSGIRYNPGYNVFEVFTSKGISYIASGVSVNVLGEIDTQLKTPVEGVSAIADGYAHYRIMQDITYAEATGFTKKNIEQGGIVDGMGFKLIGFPIYQGSALFGTNAGTIKNISLVSPTVSATPGATLDGTTMAGGICLQSTGTIDNCSLSGNDLELSIDFGGIVGLAGGTINNCRNKTNIIGLGELLGGCASSVSGAFSIVDFINEGDLSIGGTSYAAVGGILGMVGGWTRSNIGVGSMIRCVNYGDVDGNGSTKANVSLYFGGLIGYLYTSMNVVMEYCGNVGQIGKDIMRSGITSVGGLVGCTEVGLNRKVDFYHCFNAGDIVVKTNTGSIVGGLVGSTYRVHNFYYCVSRGNILMNSFSSNNVAGIVIGDMAVRDSYEGGTVISNPQAGDVSLIALGSGVISAGEVRWCMFTGNINM